MSIEDYDEVIELWQAIPGIGLSGADSRDNIDAYLSRNPEQSFVCIEAGRIVGTILCGNDGRRGFIHHTAVAPEHRRRGIGAELVRLAMGKQIECGIQKCHLTIFEENVLGKAFWREMGFYKRQDIEIMSKDL